MPKPSDVTIAPMDTDDLPAVLAIETAAFPSPWTERMFLESIRSEHGMGWVARASDRIVGYIVFAVCADECDLLNIAVAPASRRRGIARSLMLAMIAEAKCRGARVVYLDV
ncbi:MAG: GNAT family N-acetyltransferase, partial [Deltaproteobacteria bacterium]|nr:GNAT family N-acetyltransferase [Deltaproteobacteria bacterium]